MIHEDGQLQKLISLTVYLMTVLGTVAFSLGRGSFVLPCCSIAAGLLAYWLSTRERQFYLHRLVVNLIILAIAAAMASRLLIARASLEYASLADGFVYLQCALLFEKRTMRTWWDLMTLSFALLFVGGQLVQGPSFGLVMLVYCFCGMTALASIHVFRQRQRSQQPDADPADTTSPPPSAGTDWLRVLKVATCTFLVGPFSLFMRFRDRVSAGSSAQRLPVVEAGTKSGDGQRAVTINGDSSTLPIEFWRRITWMTLGSVACACVVFVVTPRFGRLEFDLAEFRRYMWGEEEEEYAPRSIGYRDRVELGELGAAFESPAKALTVQFTDYDGQRADLQGDLYLRGAVLTSYREGFWEHRRYSAIAAHADFRRREPESTGGLMRQRFTMEPMEHTGIFTIWPPFYTDRTDDIWFDEQDERFRRPRDQRKKVFQYELGTSGFVDGTQVRLTPCEAPVYTNALLQFPEHEFPALAALADQWFQEADLPEGDPVAQAEFLCKRFTSSTRFAYTLGEQPRDVSIDPVEDFIANNPYGNCEYFATALALMLRSRGIPSRVVVGYRSDELGYFDQGYVVRQEHAHSWVEAYVPPERCEQVPHRTRELADWTHGGWLRLDPTPAGSGMIAGLLGRGVEDWVVRFRSFWANRIVGMNRRQHREIVYGSLFGNLKGIARNLFDPAWWEALSRRNTIAAETAGKRHTGTDPAALWYGAVVAIALSLAIAYFVWRLRLFHQLRPAATSAKTAARVPRPATIPVSFYRRLETLLEKMGYHRGVHQTPREFAREVGPQLSVAVGLPEAGDWVHRISEAYYRVRYGRLELDGSEAANIQGMLQRLERSTDG